MLFMPGLRRYVWAPLLINLILYSLGFWVAGLYFSQVMSWLIPGWLDWLRWLLWPLFALMLSAFAFFTFTLVTNLIGAPFYGRLAERVSFLLGEAPETSEGKGITVELLGGFSSELVRMGYFGLRAVPILIVSIIPVLNLSAPFFWMLFGAWSLSLEYMAYPLEARGLRFPQQRDVVRQSRLEALAFGGMVMLGLAIPMLNVLIPPAAVIGATIYFADSRARGRAPVR